MTTFKPLVLKTKVTKVEEEFEVKAVPRKEPKIVEGGQQYFDLERRPIGWFATIESLRLRIWLGTERPEGVERGSTVTLILEPKVD